MHVLAAAYAGRGRRLSGRNVENRPMVTHARYYDGNNALCGFDGNRLADEYSEPEDNDKPPTCKGCLPKWQKAKLGL